jgi:hypothetical protein
LLIVSLSENAMQEVGLQLNPMACWNWMRRTRPRKPYRHRFVNNADSRNHWLGGPILKANRNQPSIQAFRTGTSKALRHHDKGGYCSLRVLRQATIADAADRAAVATMRAAPPQFAVRMRGPAILLVRNARLSRRYGGNPRVRTSMAAACRTVPKAHDRFAAGPVPGCSASYDGWM